MLEEGCLLRYYDLYQRLQLQFYVPLLMGAMDCILLHLVGSY